MGTKVFSVLCLLLLLAPILAEAQPRPLRVSQLLADPQRYHRKEVVLRAYFKTDIDHFAVFKESRAIDKEIEIAARRDKKIDDYHRKYCLNVVNAAELDRKFGNAANEHTFSVRGFLVADAGQPIWGCRNDAAFVIKQVLRKED